MSSSSIFLLGNFSSTALNPLFILSLLFKKIIDIFKISKGIIFLIWVCSYYMIFIIGRQLAAFFFFFFYKKPHKQLQHVYFVILFNFFNIWVSLGMNSPMCCISWPFSTMHFLMCLLLLSDILFHTGTFFLMQSPHLMCFSVASVRVSRLNRVFIWRLAGFILVRRTS